MTATDDALYMWTVYNSPKDYPGKFVARLWRIGRGQDPEPTATVLVRDTLTDISKLMQLSGLTRLPRMQDDDPVIMEVWL